MLVSGKGKLFPFLSGTKSFEKWLGGVCRVFFLNTWWKISFGFNSMWPQQNQEFPLFTNLSVIERYSEG